MSPRKLISSLLLLGTFISVSIASPLKSDEKIMFLPDIAYQLDNKYLAVIVQAWVYEQERRLGMTTALTHYLGIDKKQLTAEQTARLYTRTQLFRVDSERNKQIKVQFSDASIKQLPITSKEGRATAIIKLTSNPKLIVNNIIHYKLYQSGNPAKANEGNAIFIAKTGVSIISDIDDTIKDSQVTDKRQLLINTFINEFEAVNGMSHWYHKLANHYPHVTFHYVSSSPIQLYPALKEFLESNNFPLGSIHLRESTTWHSVIASDGNSILHKNTHIEKLLNNFPERQFILVGDSGEADPEIYAEMMRRYPKQIQFIAIRDVTQESDQAPRYQQTFKGLAGEKWAIFKDTIPTLPF